MSPKQRLEQPADQPIHDSYIAAVLTAVIERAALDRELRKLTERNAP